MKENWNIRNHQTKDIISSILKSRDIKDVDKYVRPTLDKCKDPLLLSGSRKAARKILKSIQDKEKITIFGHDDVDGVTSTVLLFDFLSKLGANNISYYIPNRAYEKFGLSRQFIQRVLQDKTKRVITVDIGITEFESIAYLRKRGIKTIILDHHQTAKEYPQASAIVDPHKKNDRFPFKYLAGVGVVVNVVKILSLMTGIQTEPLYLLLTGLGTIADRMPLIDDNRIYSKYLYSHLEQSQHPFFIFYRKKTSKLSKEKAVQNLILLLTQGRDIKGKHLGVDIFIEKKEAEISNIYSTLEERFRENREQTAKIIDLIESEYKKDKSLIFIYYDVKGLIPATKIGIATSYITDTYNIPSLVLTQVIDGLLAAETRAPSGFNWLEYLKKIEHLLIQYGGHKEAAGFTCFPRNFVEINNQLKSLFEAQQKKILNIQRESKKIIIDYVLDEEQCEINTLIEINKVLEPFGPGNPPVQYMMIHIDPQDLKKKGFVNVPEISDGDSVNIVFSILAKKFTIIDYETTEKQCSVN